MRKLIYILILLNFFLPIRVNASQLEVPEAPLSAQEYMPQDEETFAQGLLYIIKSAISAFQPEIAQTLRICLSLIAVIILMSFLESISQYACTTVQLAGVVIISLILLQEAKSMIILGTDTVRQLSEYAKVFLPVITAALASQGYVTTSSALYTGTAIFNTVLSGLISGILVPMIYIYLCVCIANNALHEQMLENLSKFIKWLMTWGLKIILYVFTGYISITGVISGSADATAVKAAKIAITGVVPVVGGIISDASEAVLVGAGVMKNSVGLYGLYAIISICIGPFLQIGAHYLLLKATAAAGSVLSAKSSVSILKDFTTAMGIVLAMTGTLCILLLISIVCFMKGVA